MAQIILIILIQLLSVQSVLASFSNLRVIRFEESQLEFVLEDSEGVPTQCQHKILSHVPWWRLKCGDREFTVDIWMELGQNKSLDLTQVTLMYHVSEGLASSGEKLVQFNTHFTRFRVGGLTDLKALNSSIDVKNGLESLVVNVSL